MQTDRIVAALARCVVVLAAAAASLPVTECAAAPPRLQPYVAASKMFVVYKPADWTVNEEARASSFRILVASPARTSLVEFRWERNPAGRPDAMLALVSWRRALVQTDPGAVVSEAYVAKDSSHAVVTVRCRVANTPVTGRYFFESTRTGISLQGFLAPETRLASERPLLLNVMSSLAFVKVLHQGTRGGLEPPVQATLVDRRAPDGSLTIRTPGDWAFLAGGGRIIAGAPGGGAGFIFTAFAGNPMLPQARVTQGVIGSPYRPPAQTLPYILIGFGHRNPVVMSAAADRGTMAQCRASIRNNCDASDMVAKWTSSGGVDCVGAFKVVNTAPGITGQWSSIVAGIWGPQKDFYRYYPILEQVAGSFSVNDQFARAYIQSGLANLRRLQQQTAAAIQSLNQAREDNQAAWEARQARKDYMDSKWDDYRRGQSYWVSDLEGGKVYQTGSSGTRDTATGDYYGGQGYNWTNFEGQNPRHPSETMREVSSYELEHGRPPR
ncbi:MAG TPA: hypothetical protein VF332_11025 [Vicinamibacterales bacterium]